MNSRRDWLVRSLFTAEVDGTVVVIVVCVCLARVSREGRRFATTRFSMWVPVLPHRARRMMKRQDEARLRLPGSEDEKDARDAHVVGKRDRLSSFPFMLVHPGSTT